ncbi:MAG: SDR family NAD(P)-dependent oxidoreductase [Chitinophagales bacterium]|nr:SDR family NAD(P)-dependent oxidoreductase [Chitinophagales bacterium]
MPDTILITGATSGFGRAIAEKFAENGYTICATGRREDRLEELKSELEDKYGVKVIAMPFDVRNRNEVTEAVNELRSKIDKIDILVNNAGLASGLSTIDEGDIDDWDVMIDTNIKGLLYVTRMVMPLLKSSRKAHIINIGSTAAKTVYKNGNVYCATKFAVDALSQAMRIDLLPYGIKVTAIHPGMAETEFSLVRFKGDADRAKNVYNDLKPLMAEDIANTAFYCATLPAHVCINDLTITCTNQANSFYTLRNSELAK